MTDDLHTFLRSRRSIRHFLAEPVPVDVLQRILTTATYAPSAHNKQPWRFIVLINSESRSRLIAAITDKFRRDMTADGTPETEIQWRIERTTRRTSEAPVIIVLCHDVAQVNPQRDTARQQAELTMGIQSVALAGLQNFTCCRSRRPWWNLDLLAFICTGRNPPCAGFASLF